MPPSVTNSPGYYSFDRTPYLRSIVDCLGVDSPIRELAWIKGSQIGATTGIENGVGYFIDHVGSVPILWVTADQELATQRLQANILPMVQASGLSSKIRSNDEGNSRKTGKTDKKLEFIGGGSLRPLGAQNANKFRQDSARVLIRDEIDAWPAQVGRDGDPLQLTLSRTVAFEDSRKVFDISTPLIKGQSKIEKRFLRGDQRYYYVKCLKCGEAQTLKWRRQNPDTGEVTGITWETDPETKKLVPGSVRYLCRYCGHPHRNEDKTRLLSPEFRAEWRPTATPVHPTVRSYHLSALYSPVGMQSWEACVQQWLDAWDVENAKPKDIHALQVFYNNVLGDPYELRGEKLTFEGISSFRRHAYKYGEIPNRFASQIAGGPIQLLTCAVDVQDNDLAVAVYGWAPGRRSFLVYYERFKGPTDQLDHPDTWGRLQSFIETTTFRSDDNKVYGIALTLIDSGHRNQVVYRFVAPYAQGVLAIKGEASQTRAASNRLFHQISTPLGERAFGLTVDAYKERNHFSLKHSWDGQSMQPEGHFNFPLDITDGQLKELTVERRVEAIDPTTRQRKGWKWVRPSGSKNELWDLSIYNSAALDILAWSYCRQVHELEQVIWPVFWDHTSKGAYFRAA